jgi:hypothetical protein
LRPYRRADTTDEDEEAIGMEDNETRFEGSSLRRDPKGRSVWKLKRYQRTHVEAQKSAQDGESRTKGIQGTEFKG